MPSKPRRRGLILGVATVLTLAVAMGVYVAARKVPHLLSGPGCVARAGRTALSLDVQQASIAATIAGVAHHRRMPAYAVQVAYAAAMQESKLHDLGYGDRDSVGVFQQRPSEGWGSARRLMNPVYASTRFFQVLATVPDYTHMPVYQAAQAVQRSADGYAYIQYEQMAASMAAAFTGHSAHAVWCWSPGAAPSGRADLQAARSGLVAAFGAVGAHRAVAPGDAPRMVVRVPRRVVGWAVATWLVTHAGAYKLHEVRYHGYLWRATAGQSGWTADPRPLPANQVEAS